MSKGTYEIKHKLSELINESDAYHALRGQIVARAQRILTDCAGIEGPLGQLIRSYASAFLSDCEVDDSKEETDDGST